MNSTRYIIGGLAASPFFIVYKFDGSSTFTKLADPSTLPPAAAAGVAVSPCGRYFVVAHSTTPFISIYKRDDSDVLTKLSDPSNLPAGNGITASFSPDGKYLVVGHSTTPFMTVYERSGDTFTKLANPATLPATSGAAMFSNTGRFIAMSQSSTPFLLWYELSAGVLTKLTNPATQPTSATNRNLSWVGDDDHYLVQPSSSSPFIVVYERSGTTLTKLTDPATLPSVAARMNRARYRADDATKIHLYYAHGTGTDGVGEYQITESTDTFTRNASFPFVDTELGATRNAIAVSHDGLLMAVTGNASPFIAFYDNAVATAPTKYANPSTLPGGEVNAVFINAYAGEMAASTAGATANFDQQVVTAVLTAAAGPALADFDGLFEISYINAFTSNDVADFNGTSDFGALVAAAGPATADFDGASNFGTLVGAAGPATADFNLLFNPSMFATDSVAITSTVLLEQILTITETFNITAVEEAVEEIESLIEQLVMSDSGSTQVSMIRNLVDEIGVEALAELVVAVLLLEQMNLTDTVTGERALLASIAETLIAQGVITSIAQFNLIAATALAFNDLAETGIDVDAVDTMQLVSSIQSYVSMVSTIMDSTQIGDATIGGLTITMDVTEEAALAANLMSQASLTAAIVEMLVADAVITIDGLPYHGWAMNTEGVLPISHYPQFPFNSMFKVGDKYLATGDDGLFELTGDTDDGDPIIESFKTGKLDFGSPYLKTVRDVYMGFTATGRVLLKVTTSQEGVERERWYELKTDKGAVGKSQEGRVRLGKGVKSRYWQFEWVAIDGDNLSLDQVNMDVVKLTRRT